MQSLPFGVSTEEAAGLERACLVLPAEAAPWAPVCCPGRSSSPCRVPSLGFCSAKGRQEDPLLPRRRPPAAPSSQRLPRQTVCPLPAEGTGVAQAPCPAARQVVLADGRRSRARRSPSQCFSSPCSRARSSKRRSPLRRARTRHL